jgi:hypothetical protein|tara:strand:+ start:463 stop:567 length:105 start_codon:yes stop_codon:yes gene_type:complete
MVLDEKVECFDPVVFFGALPDLLDLRVNKTVFII